MQSLGHGRRARGSKKSATNAAVGLFFGLVFLIKQRICLHNIQMGFSTNKCYGRWQLHATVLAMPASAALVQLINSFSYHTLSGMSPKLLVG